MSGEHAGGLAASWVRIPPSPPVLVVLDGEVAVPCTRNPLRRDRIPARGVRTQGLPASRSDDGSVPRDGCFRTPSGPEGSSGKEEFPGAAGIPGRSYRRRYHLDPGVDGRCTANRGERICRSLFCSWFRSLLILLFSSSPFSLPSRLWLLVSCLAPVGPCVPGFAVASRN